MNITHAPDADRLPDDAGWLFPEYDLESIDVDAHPGLIIERILEKGSWEQLRWLFATYEEGQVAEWIRRHGFRLLSKRSFSLWRLTLGVDHFEAPDWAIAAKEMEPW
jgi:hypothetical protein